jgi:hypothetical protein
MSYVLHLWREPLPLSLEQAQRQLPELRATMQLVPDPKASQLVAALAERLPDDDADRYWTEPPDAEPASPVLTLSPVTAELPTVLPVVLAVAREQGWVVLDGQAGEVWLPGGERLERNGRRIGADLPQVPVDDDVLASPSAMTRWLRERLQPVFSSRGYRALKGEIWFKKTTSVGRFQLYGRVVRNVVEFSFDLAPAYPAALAGAVNSDGGPRLDFALHALAQRHGLAFTCDEPPAIYHQPLGQGHYESTVTSAAALHRLGDELANLFDEVVLDFADRLQSLQDLDHWANRVDDAACPFAGLRRREDYRLFNLHPDLLLARAVDAPDFETRARQRLAQYEADAFGRGLLPQLKALLSHCGLAT